MLTLLLSSDCIPVVVLVELHCCGVNAGTREASHEAHVKARVAVAEENLERMVALFSRQAAAAAAHLFLLAATTAAAAVAAVAVPWLCTSESPTPRSSPLN